MTGIALVSAKGSPGVTTCAVLLAAVWPTAVLVEADPAGGDLRAWYPDPAGRPLRPDLGVVSLLAAHTPTGAVTVADAGTDRGLLAHAQQLPGGLPVLIGPGSPAQVDTLRGRWPQLADAITGHDGVVLVDAGRLTQPGPGPSADPTVAVLRACAVTLIVCRATVASIAHTRDLLIRLAQLDLAAQLLVIGPASRRDDTARALGLYPELVHVLPDDPTAADGLSGEWNRKLNRTPLLAAARRVAGALHRQLHPDPQAHEHAADGAAGGAAEAWPEQQAQESVPVVIS